MAIFLPLSGDYAREVAGRLTHYGKYSYLAFNQGRNAAKGIWPISNSPLFYKWEGHQGMTERR